MPCNEPKEKRLPISELMVNIMSVYELMVNIMSGPELKVNMLPVRMVPLASWPRNLSQWKLSTNPIVNLTEPSAVD